MPTQSDGDGLDAAPHEGEALDLVGLQTDVDETAYVWNLASDGIEWESNAAAVLGVADMATIATGTAFNALIASEHASRRITTISQGMAVPGERGVPFRLQYQFRPSGGRGGETMWIEDHGRWWPDASGRPVRARGVIRLVDETFVDRQRALYGNDRDDLTGQLDRRHLTEALETVIQRSARSSAPSAFLMVAVNNLAIVNETFGFTVGDEVLQATAGVIRSKLRAGDSLGRFSSNKFGIVLNECGPGAMRIAAERFMKAVRSTTIRTSVCQLSATISAGGVIVPEHATTVSEAFGASLMALERAKSRRFDCFMAFAPDEVRESTRQRNITIADEVMSALDENRLFLVLQPMISARTGQPAIYECLLRMERPDGTVASAGEFINVAEQLGLSRLIDRRTLDLSIGLLEQHPTLQLSVNVSGLTAADRDWLAALQRMTLGRRSLAERLVIEITETAIISDLDQAIAFCDTLKELGCRVAIDDFGAGYTSFKNLKHLPIDIVKIDGAFVKNIAAETADRVFIKTMVEIADTFGMETVAEWVGDAESARILTEAGITYLQGFFYGQPIPAAELKLR
ncbi:MAG: bifunctional diguanylate cyclase/phosphodiesterase [Hyphomicrobiaceae bacterium]|nr:bifunctional diguanylate cyclase/phosphodiesterase [Hyphomicrobiaceae bacterium]